MLQLDAFIIRLRDFLAELPALMGSEHDPVTRESCTQVYHGVQDLLASTVQLRDRLLSMEQSAS